MRLAGLLLALLIHGGSPVELSPVDNQGCETDADCGLGNWCDSTAQFCPLGQPGIPDPNVTSLLLADDREPRQHGEPRQHLDHDYEFATARAANARRPRAPAAAGRSERTRAREHMV